MHDKIKETAMVRSDSSNNPDMKALQFYFENRAKINNLYNIAQTARDWLQSIFCGSSFVWGRQVAEPMRTKRPEDKHRYAIYRIAGLSPFAAHTS